MFRCCLRRDRRRAHVSFYEHRTWGETLSGGQSVFGIALRRWNPAALSDCLVLITGPSSQSHMSDLNHINRTVSPRSFIPISTSRVRLGHQSIAHRHRLRRLVGKGFKAPNTQIELGSSPLPPCTRLHLLGHRRAMGFRWRHVSARRFHPAPMTVFFVAFLRRSFLESPCPCHWVPRAFSARFSECGHEHFRMLTSRVFTCPLSLRGAFVLMIMFGTES